MYKPEVRLLPAKIKKMSSSHRIAAWNANGLLQHIHKLPQILQLYYRRFQYEPYTLGFRLITTKGKHLNKAITLAKCECQSAGKSSYWPKY